MISFSGIDCSGKSTQIDLLCKEFDKAGKKYEVIWSRGGYTPGIQFLKKLINRGGKEMSKEERLAYSAEVNKSSKKRKLLFTLSLMDLWFYYSIALRFKSIGKTVICDRYIWDTYIDFKMKYPEYAFEKGFWWRLTLKTMLKPNPSFCFFIPAEESMRRSGLKDEPFPEPVEVRDERIRLYVAEVENNRWDEVVDASKNIEAVFEDVKTRVRMI
ncbi:MAG: hypothetical protein IKJ55_07055 [Clostridia bacterium]|nr:hypothetical protein [Clostridia bacterium]